MIFALMLMLAPSGLTYGLSGIVNNQSGNTLVRTGQNVTPVRIMVTSGPLRSQGTAIFYNAKPSSTGYKGTIDYATACGGPKGTKHRGTYRLSLRVTPDKNEGSCSYTGDAACRSRCSVMITPKSCRNVGDCTAHYIYTIGK